ncbi:MAG: C39 family peptidase [Syntrophomonas sp.]
MGKRPWGAMIYSKIAGSKNTVGLSGCGPTSMAMVTTFITGKEVNPGTMAQYALDNGYRTVDLEKAGFGTSSGLFYSVASNPKWGTFNCSTTNNLNEVESALSDGKHIAIVGVGKGHFTQRGHYIVLADPLYGTS